MRLGDGADEVGLLSGLLVGPTECFQLTGQLMGTLFRLREDSAGPLPEPVRKVSGLMADGEVKGKRVAVRPS